MKKAVSYDEGAKGLILILLVAQLFLQNGLLLVLGGIIFAFLFYALLQPGKPNIFTIIFIYHFIQIAASVWLSNWKNEDVNFRSPSATQAIIFSYIGLIALFTPIIIYQNKIPAFSFAKLRESANKLSIRKTFIAYIISFFISGALAAVAFGLPGWTQVIFSFIGVRWLFFTLFGLQVFLKKQMKKEFFLCFAFEFISGFYSFFSEFKTVLFFAVFIFFFFLRSVNLKNLLVVLISGILGFYLMAYYSGIKGAYREYLNQGSRSQTVQVAKGEALLKLVELASDTSNNIDKSMEGFLDRMQYTYHLSKSMDLIPANMDYQNGKNWGETLEYVLTPRLLNPQKPIFRASTKATKYTGIPYSGTEQGVSFSLGYFADCYVDFGRFGMMIPLLIIGLIYGSTYFYFLRKSSNNYLFNVAVVAAMFMEFTAYEVDSTMLTGRLFSTLLTFTFLKFTLFPWVIRQLRTTPLQANKDKGEAIHPA